MRELTDYWQRQLRLQDWDVTVRVVRWHEVDGSPLGLCRVRWSTRDAEILLLDPQDYGPDRSGSDRDQELTLVHELLHIAFPGDRSDGSCSTTMEQAVEATARALVALNRGHRR